MEIRDVNTVRQEGNLQCNHEWVYQRQNTIYTTNPPKFPFTKICKICGRIEEGTTSYTEEFNTYENIYNKFYNSNMDTVYNNPCENCPSRPKNGEIKTCSCTLPYTHGQYKIT